ncbi:lysozyme inhibitor LprI family protein [Terriglobus saanensis]|uniref:Lysozyme inhibitor LprI-like N-terminal domain-containing protein n=1 Tax=Terriglobus saanensis (strain ATCC BAA-1853 / DSM 23119 / SP1PR4) TaxID=401053 RepID=E8V689_TERSS|nr:lysozyme inhibitor LprI family protein [Terriglobus saanensis]ADV84980.1 hypothetical protein AciPR4_4236 [Terriglobus saanensis SP1PR4]
MRWLGVALLCGVSLGAQVTTPEEKNWEAVCKKVTSAPLAAPELKGPLRAEQLPQCDAEGLYYGFKGAADNAAALQCGWWQRAHPQPTRGDMFYGAGVLTMLYANGRGVAKNYDLALRFACEQTWAAPAEMEYRIGHLEALRDGKMPATKPFDLCDDGTSGLSMGACEAVTQGLADKKRMGSADAVAKRLPESAKDAFAKLQTAETAFEIARARGEVDLTGTGRAAFSLEEEGRLKDQFQINLQRFAKGDVPAATAPDVTKLDAEMNDVYRGLQNSQKYKNASGGAVTALGIQKAQRAWLLLRDAWIAFAAKAYPGLARERVEAQLIRLRLHQLRSLASSKN